MIREQSEVARKEIAFSYLASKQMLTRRKSKRLACRCCCGGLNQRWAAAPVAGAEACWGRCQCLSLLLFASSARFLEEQERETKQTSCKGEPISRSAASVILTWCPRSSTKATGIKPFEFAS